MYPSVDELKTYGVDAPLPESEEELLCEYKFHEGDEELGIPPITYKDLEGYAVPPEGIYVTRAGGGKDVVRHTFVYPPGTFFENRVTINKPMGAQHTDIIRITAENRKNAITQGAVEAFEEMGLAVFDNIKEKDVSVIKELTKQTIKTVVESNNPREMINLLKFVDKRYEQKDEAIAKHTRSASMTPEEARKWFDLYKEAQDRNITFEVVEGEYEDIEE